MAKRLTYDCATGELAEVEMQDDELAAYEELRAASEDNAMPPAAILRLLLEDVANVNETKPILDTMLILLGG